MKGWLWRKFWQFTHRFNWHYMPVHGPLEDGRSQAWCQWCGLRDYVYDKGRALMAIRADAIIRDVTERGENG